MHPTKDTDSLEELEFTPESITLLAARLVPKLKQPDYFSNFNRGGQAFIAVKLSTVWYL